MSDSALAPLSREALPFAPGLLAIQESPPAPLPRTVLYVVVALFFVLMLWAAFGHLDVIASAQGRLVPRTYIKVVQPADAGIVKEILVHEGEAVSAGQVLLRMDTHEAEADSNTLAASVGLKSLQLRRIQAELAGAPLRRVSDDNDELFERVNAQFSDHRRAYENALEQARQHLQQAEDEHQAGIDTLEKLRKTNPLLKSQAQSYMDLGKDGFVAQVLVNEKQRQYVENEQDLHAQEARVAGLDAAVTEARQHVAEITAKYRSDLQNERVQAEGEFNKLQQDSLKQTYKNGLLELRAPQAGIVKDLATHTVGTVVSAGTVLLSLVPQHEPMMVEMMVRNDDVGFVHPHQPVEIKLAAYPFQKYGTLVGEVAQVWPDAAENEGRTTGRVEASPDSSRDSSAGGYRALVDLKSQTLKRGDVDLSLLAGMQVVAEINEGRRTVLEYLLSPVEKVARESGRER